MIVCELTRLPDEKLNFHETDTASGLKLFVGAKYSKTIERLSRDTFEADPSKVLDIVEDQADCVWSTRSPKTSRSLGSVLNPHSSASALSPLSSAEA